MVIESRRNRTLPSAIAAFAPPGWKAYTSKAFVQLIAHYPVGVLPSADAPSMPKPFWWSAQTPPNTAPGPAPP